LQLTDGTILKLFRRKTILSSALFYPYAKRFSNNVRILHQLRILTPEIISMYRFPSIERDAVHYKPLSGKSLRHIRAHQHDCPEDLFDRLGRFTAELHHKGIYFRSIHLGNIILTPNYELGLIDLADLKSQTRPLSSSQRKRNFKHMLRDKDDSAWLESQQYGDLLGSYNKETRRLQSL
jgi:tRNA A-37 threonylcarbamoyl transferase component Bud32